MDLFDRVFTETQKFLTENHPKYSKLVKIVKTYLNDKILPLRLNTEAVFMVYSRKDYPGQSGDIKDTVRLTSKIVNFKQKRPEWKNIGAIQIHDIVACRVLVYYKSQISFVVEEIRRTAKLHSLSVVDEVYRKDLGYYAHHLILR
jgi:ppGpp synthetase/RelA/SpoT-type nucleotidyltranferase